MSYAIIHGIRIEDSQVILKYADNNVYPRRPHEWACPSLSLILQEEGQDALDLEILSEYESGNFQKGKNKYTRALEILLHDPEYKKFCWRRNGTEKAREDREAFNAVKLRALKSRLPSDKFIVTKIVAGYQVQYFHKLTKRYAHWTIDKSKAKIFHWQEDADNLKKYFTNSEEWRTEKL